MPLLPAAAQAEHQGRAAAPTRAGSGRAGM